MEILESERLIFQTYVQYMKQLCVADTYIIYITF